jgi:hypothetical protein
VQLEQFVRTQAVPRERTVVFEELARREREHRIVVRRDYGRGWLRWRSRNSRGGGDAL